MDEDPEWYPGKTYRKRPGPQAVLHGKKRKQVAKSAMNLKKEGAEPTYAAIAARCPAAVVNPDTGKPVDKKLVYIVLKTDCYDRSPEEPWVCEPVYTRWFFPEDLMEQRLRWAKRLLEERYSATMMYAYLYTLAGTAVVVTLDLSAKNLWALQRGHPGGACDHWLTDERNVIVLWLAGRQTWCERAPVSPPRTLPLDQRRRVA